MGYSAFQQEALPVSEIVRFRLPHESSPGEEVVLYGEAEVMGDEVNLLHVYAFRNRIADVGKSFWEEWFPYSHGFQKEVRRALEQAALEANMGAGWKGWLPCDAIITVEDSVQQICVKTDSRCRLREVHGWKAKAEIGLKHIENVVRITDDRYIVETTGAPSDALKELALLAQ